MVFSETKPDSNKPQPVCIVIIIKLMVNTQVALSQSCSLCIVVLLEPNINSSLVNNSITITK